MHNHKKDQLVKSILLTSIVTMLVMTITNFTIANASIDLPELDDVNNLGQSADCVVVVVGCDGTGSVDSSGDTTIGSNNGNNDANGFVPGPPSIDSQVYAVTGEAVTGNTDPIVATADCNPGDTVLSGGFHIVSETDHISANDIEDRPTANLDGWQVNALVFFDTTITVNAVCYDNP